MIKNFSNYVKFLVKSRITADDFLLLYMVYKEDADLIQSYLNTNKGPSPTYGFSEERIDYLISEGYLKSYARDSDEVEGDFNFFDVTEKFRNMVWVDNAVAGRELLAAYPRTLTVEGKVFISTGGGVDVEDTISLYCEKIGNDKVKHAFVLEMIEKGKRLKLIQTKFHFFVTGEMWDAIDGFQEPRKTSNFTDV